MNARKLRNRLRFIVEFGAPLSLVLPFVACGGATESGDGLGGASNGGATVSTDGGASVSGGAGAGGTTGNGGRIGAGGMVTNGGQANCDIQPNTGIGPDCTLSKTYTVDAACAVPTLTTARCSELCKTTFLVTQCSFTASTTPDKVNLVCPPTCVAGRRPAGFVEGLRDSNDFAAYLARTAELEAAAVPAFRRLRQELHEHGAPRSLLRALSRAARDETRHARATRALAKRHAARVNAPRLGSRKARSLEAIATENVTEGCVRELYGALVATYQSEHAEHAELQRLMRRIAIEETQHAALSMRVHAWLEQRLDPAARERVRAAKLAAQSELVSELKTAFPPEVAEPAGLPTPDAAVRLFDSLFS